MVRISPFRGCHSSFSFLSYATFLAQARILLQTVLPSGQCGGHVLGDSDGSTTGTALEEGASRGTLTPLRGASDGKGNGCATLSPSVMHRKKAMEKESSYGPNQRV